MSAVNITCSQYKFHQIAHGDSHFPQGHFHPGLAIVSLHQNVGIPGMQADGHVAGKGPDGGGPDHEEGLGQVKACQLAQIVLHGELDVDGGTGIVLVLDVGFCHGGGAEGAPGDGLQTLVDEALVEHPAKDLDLLGLEVLVHGAVGIFPVAHNA